MAGSSELKNQRTGKHRLASFLTWLNAVASVLTIVTVVGGLIFVDRRISTFEKQMRAISSGLWDIQVTVSKPNQFKPVVVRSENIYLNFSGRVELLDKSRRPMPSVANVFAYLHLQHLELLALVRPHKSGLTWWVQTRPAVMRNGVFQGVVQVGEKPPQASPLQYDLVLLVVERGTLSLGQRLPNLPVALASSRMIPIIRLY